jgi:hypothetical protein
LPGGTAKVKSCKEESHQDLGKLSAEISRKLGKIDLLFTEETLDVYALDGLILELRETLQQ